MLSLIFQTLAISSYLVGGYNYQNALTPHTDTGGQVIYYEVDNYNEDKYSQNTYTIVTEQGSISFEVVDNMTYVNNLYSYDLQFKVSGESIYSNLYLYNIEAIYGNSNNPQEQRTTLPNIYFKGQQNYYEDNESGNYTIQWTSSLNQPYMYLNFNIAIMPSYYFDGSEYQQGYTDGWNAGNDNGWDDGYRNGYNDGSADAWEEASQQDETAVTIFSGILSVGLLPVNFFLAILNFEVFGINIGAFVSALLTVAIVIIVTRIVVNGGNKGD